MCCEMKKPRSLPVRRYAERLIDLNEYLSSFPEANLTNNIGVIKLNEILLNIVPNRWSRQAYVKGFDCEYITFKKAVNMFDRMEIFESIYEVVVEPSYKKSYPGRHQPFWSQQAKDMRIRLVVDSPQEGWERWQAHKQRVDITTGKSKTCLIHCPGNSSEECKVLGDFGTKYANVRPTKDRGSIPVPRKKINRRQENNVIFNNAVY